MEKSFMEQVISFTKNEDGGYTDIAIRENTPENSEVYDINKYPIGLIMKYHGEIFRDENDKIHSVEDDDELCMNLSTNELRSIANSLLCFADIIDGNRIKKKETKTSSKNKHENVESEIIPDKADIEELLNTKVINYDLFSSRAIICFKIADIYTVRDLVRHQKTDFQNFRNIGKKTIQELDKFIKDHGLHWGMGV